MFVMSMKTSKKKLLIYVTVFVVLCAALILFLNRNRGDANVAAKDPGSTAASNAQRVAYLKTFGWTVSEEPIEVQEVAIPAEFDDVYQNYNTIQKDQGFDLTAYSGMRAKRYTYEVLNYPNAQDPVRANVLVYDNKVIGGDVCSVNLDGFMHGFALPKA